MSTSTPNTEIDAETMLRAKYCLIAILADMAKAEVQGLSAATEENIRKWRITIARSIQFYADKANHFEKHFKRLAKEHGPANAALDTARREWAKRGEG